MTDLHESFESLQGPGLANLVRLNAAWQEWSDEAPIPSYDRFDLLNWPDLLDWMSVAHFAPAHGDRYAVENTRIEFEGSKREELFQSGAINLTDGTLDEFFIERWASIYLRCIEDKRSVFAKSRVMGIDREFIEFEIGLFPFSDASGEISHVLSLVERFQG